MTEQPNRRQGPIHFRVGENAISQSRTCAGDVAAIGEARVSEETPTHSKELRLTPSKRWVAAAVGVVLIGVLFSPGLLIFAGIVFGIVAAVVLGRRARRTEARLRDEWHAGRGQR